MKKLINVMVLAFLFSSAQADDFVTHGKKVRWIERSGVDHQDIDFSYLKPQLKEINRASCYARALLNSVEIIKITGERCKRRFHGPGDKSMSCKARCIGRKI
ncbi:MAG: hypothetical protein QE271_00440 [Bacteriovoracaceae bacterium]|nr:hypothetical protein [Bacteriovoracaceae bacterium]